MVILPKPRHLKRFQEIAWLLIKYGRSDVVKSAGLEGVLHEGAFDDSPVAAEAEGFTADLERLGPTFIKLGQLLSTRSDLLPAPYLTALSRLQDKVEPVPFEQIEHVIASELEVRISKAFAELEASPIAAASLGQVHRARLRDGRRVAVKVQRPGIRQRVIDDLEAIAEIVSFVDAHTDTGRRYEFGRMLEEFRRTLLRELDYLQEAGNLITLGRNLAGFPRLVVPQPIDNYTTARVLTMEYVAGTKVTALSPAVLLEVDGPALAETLFAAYLQQVLIDGFFHADPHPGNLLLTADGRMGLIDLGMVARVSPRIQDYLLQLILCVADGRSDEAATFAMKLGETREGFREPDFRRRVSDLVLLNRNASVEQLEVGKIMLEITRISAETGLRLPSELSMLGKTLLNLDEVGRTLDPSATPNMLVRRHASALMQRRMLQAATPANLFSGALETKELLERLPERLNRILARFANDQIEVKVDAIDEDRLMVGFQKVANRITVGLLLAALIIGAAMLMRVETTFRILGYPGIAILFFVIAAAGALWLIATILFGDD